MRLTARVLRTAVLSAMLLAPLALPAFAGPDETDFLHGLAGTWNGKGRISGAEAGILTCRLTFRPSGERLNYNGRCAYSGGNSPQSFSGRITYNDRRGVYESTSQGRTVAGQKSGSTLVFTTTQNSVRGRGTSTLKLSPGGISVTFDMVNARSGEASKGSIPFTKA